MLTSIVLLFAGSAGNLAVPPMTGKAADSRTVNSQPAGEILFKGLGNHRRPVTTSSRLAQRYFDQGLNFLFAFNHDEAIRSFSYASKLDPNCAMAWWGIALANGPHINNPMVDEVHAKAAWNALEKAVASSANCSPVEQALIQALQARYANPQPADRKPIDIAYAEAMRQVWQRFPKDADIGTLFAESMMDLRPWDLWTADHKPQPGTPEIVATLERVFTINPNHPLGLHLYIHAVEASPQPEKARAASDRLRNLQPGLGHMVHMPSHIDVRLGRWKEAVVANARAIETDKNYRKLRPKQGFYRLYMLHNQHMLAYAAIMRGESKRAIEAVDSMIAGVPEQWARENAPIADGFMAMPIEMRVRFGRWDEVLAAPEPKAYFPLARAMRLAARGIAYAAKGKVSEARAEQIAFLKAKAQVPKEAFFSNNTAADILNVATAMLAGEIDVRAGETEKGLAELREAIKQEDRLRYDEPPSWILPVRHALGATLTALGRHDEAISVYRADLKKLPHNGWSLYGLARCLNAKGKRKEAATLWSQFRQVWADADVKLSSSCFCQPGKLGALDKEQWTGQCK